MTSHNIHITIIPVTINNNNDTIANHKHTHNANNITDTHNMLVLPQGGRVPQLPAAIV